MSNQKIIKQSTSSPILTVDEVGQWKTVSYSCIGKRAENQDRQLLISGEKGVLAVIADGMGGHKDGGLGHEKLKITKEDAFILCSDGFWEHTTDEEMLALLDADNLRQTIEKRAHTAVERAGDKADNTTAIAIRSTNYKRPLSFDMPKRLACSE